MIGLIDWLRPRWPVLAFLASGALLAAAHAFERIGGYDPCPLCLLQRERHWIVLGIAAAAFAALFFIKSVQAQRVAAGVIALAFAWSFYEAGHHVAVEQKWIPATCIGETDPNAITVFSDKGTSEIPNCDTPAWTLWGISMAGFNALASLALLLASLLVALAPQRKRPDV